MKKIAQKTEERAEESLVMKRLYTAFLEGGMDIDEAVVLLRSGGNDGKMDEKGEKKKTEVEMNETKMEKKSGCECVAIGLC